MTTPTPASYQAAADEYCAAQEDFAAARETLRACSFDDEHAAAVALADAADRYHAASWNLAQFEQSPGIPLPQCDPHRQPLINDETGTYHPFRGDL